MKEVLVDRRDNVVSSIGDKTLLVCSGRPRLRNMTAATYPFRASSEFLYLFGFSVPGAIGLVSKSEQRILLDPIPAGDEIWHGEREGIEALRERSGVADISYKDQGQNWLGKTSTEKIVCLPTLDPITNREIEAIIGRPIDIFGQDNLAVEVMVRHRLLADKFTLEQVKEAISITRSAYEIGFNNLAPGVDEREIRALMEAECTRNGVSCAFPSIVTHRGDVLHNSKSGGPLAEDDLLLVDFGAESSAGYASDVTRTWPVGGTFSSVQQELYDLVLEIQKTAIRLIAPGVEFAEIHQVAAYVLAKGLISIGLLKGDPETIVDVGSHALFFPHGLGHVIGLDAHDMEIFGELAGYAPGRVRSEQFGKSFLRLDRPLEKGMIITIEPGIYNIKSLLAPNEQFKEAQRYLSEDASSYLDEFTGIRIEDMILVTEDGFDVLTSDIPKETSEFLGQGD